MLFSGNNACYSWGERSYLKDLVAGIFAAVAESSESFTLYVHIANGTCSQVVNRLHFRFVGSFPGNNCFIRPVASLLPVDSMCLFETGWRQRHKRKAVLGEMFTRELFNNCSTHKCVFKPLGCVIINCIPSVTEYICTYAFLNTFWCTHMVCFSLLRIVRKVAQKKMILADVNLEFVPLVRVSSRSWSE